MIILIRSFRKKTYLCLNFILLLFKKLPKRLAIFLFLIPFYTQAQSTMLVDNVTKTVNDITMGADRTKEYLPLLKGKRVAIVANQSSTIQKTHLVDSLLKLGVIIKKVFCPEHGFRGSIDAGEPVKTEKDPSTGLTIITLYGKNKKPLPTDLKNVDVVIFDIQDVGVRFYTYLSTLHYVMEACAENGKQLIVMDRPNPHGYYIDGPVLKPEFKSFLGLDPVPLVYGMTIGEYATMINGEGWLAGNIKCNLKIIPLLKYNHADLYELPIRPSPNLPNMTSIYLYPSLGLFEGTVVSVGRGTDFPFQVIGHPNLQNTSYNFTPTPKPGAMQPKYNGELCHGHNLVDFGTQYLKNSKNIYLFWLIGTYNDTPDKNTFFDENFNFHAGNSILQQQIKEGKKESVIRQSWVKDIEAFKLVRKKYLLYADFE